MTFMTIIFLCKFPFCLSIHRENKFSFFSPQGSNAYPVSISERKGGITALAQFGSIYKASCCASRPAALPVSVCDSSALFFRKELGK